jgi:hypothetical protein
LGASSFWATKMSFFDLAADMHDAVFDALGDPATLAGSGGTPSYACRAIVVEPTEEALKQIDRPVIREKFITIELRCIPGVSTVEQLATVRSGWKVIVTPDSDVAPARTFTVDGKEDRDPYVIAVRALET